MPQLAELQRSPNALAHHYRRFRVQDRLMLTGHSHQAWPDVAFEGQVEAWNDAAEWVDGKWSRALTQADRVRSGFATLLDAAPEEISLGQNTHELVVRFLSALDLKKRPRLVSTDGEFHTLRRQLDRLAETGLVEIVRVPALPAGTLAERLSSNVNESTAAVLVSSVLFGNAHIVPHLEQLRATCEKLGSELLVDVYHHLNVVPFSIRSMALQSAFVVGGGYKYCQLGEGNCFLRVPPGREDLRPVITGWFSEFSQLTERHSSEVYYGTGPERWAGATYDPTSHYRAARVFDFFQALGLSTGFLRQVSQHQVDRLALRFDELRVDPSVIQRDRSVPLEGIGGFLALQSDRAGELCAILRDRGVLTDYRGATLRFGPAPYHSDPQLDESMEQLGEVIRGL